jgi:pimeloyl-ACP methyl ester carboxylesterase
MSIAAPADGNGSAPLRQPRRPPEPWIQALEQRVVFELGALAASSPLLRAAGRGDHHPVLVVPGFSAGDPSTVALRAFIRSWGYWAHGWHVGTNFGPIPRILDATRARLDAIHARHGRPVTIVGWSAGGLYARHVARAAPEKVRQVISLGSPLQIVEGDRTTASTIADRLAHLFDPEFHRLADHERGTLPVPSTSIYSRTDGVVRWQMCLDVVDDRHENVEVLATHVGMGFNPAALYVVADRLRQREGDWQPFRAPSAFARLYPRAVDLRLR